MSPHNDTYSGNGLWTSAIMLIIILLITVLSSVGYASNITLPQTNIGVTVPTTVPSITMPVNPPGVNVNVPQPAPAPGVNVGTPSSTPGVNSNIPSSAPGVNVPTLPPSSANQGIPSGSGPNMPSIPGGATSGGTTDGGTTGGTTPSSGSIIISP